MKILPALLITAVLLSGPPARAAEREVIYPPHPNVVDVKAPPYNARGDGIADDTEALQRAINDHTGRHRVLFFPPGTYLVSATLTWPKKWQGRENWGFTMLQGPRPSA